ncbi:hydantoinase/oxoprolinase family protein [Desulfopila inferna]|uniref:hydantoinase/oxoprolinase family protein n=1 Tax=Desulfopila inferna TaxID=468528 RepID=UPI001966314E|nr:hydantoinase/oxoprolinase family protein [Desulfopila inferna]MBM9603716.1 hydantoinase/oxoprolinase family protein [Desulfopila inferna]
MIIGIDVGGTHADGVLLWKNTIAAKKKVWVDHDNLGDSIITLLESLLPPDREALKRIHLSTTLCTNALINEKLDEVGMFVQAGPGMNPDFLKCGDHLHFFSGAVDHRGQILRGPGVAEIQAAASELQRNNISSIGIVTKFSHRNNEHELWVRDQLQDDFTHISMGHRISGMPNFPRRVYTTWVNSALKSQFYQFKEAMEEGFSKLGLTCPCYILKADGGTIPFDVGCEFPCQSIHSGPSASIMGALALVDNIGDAILLDIGGTTTDIGIFADGVPLLEPYGATVGGRPTLIRAQLTKSIGLGGDSSVIRQGNGFQIGPERRGPPMAFGGMSPTPTDAMVVLGRIKAGSQTEARAAMERLCPEKPPEETAVELLHCFVRTVHRAVMDMIEEIFSRPVYTVSAFLEREKITPERLISIGGPALALQSFLQDTFGMECVVPPDYEVANAIGAARARLTVQASLYCDTSLGRLSIPEISCMESIGKRFNMEDAELLVIEAVRKMALEMGAETIPEIDFIERLEMNTVKGFATTGKIISLKAQIRPGLVKVEE